MKIQRVKQKSDDYTVINSDFILDPNLSMGSIGFLATIMALPDDWKDSSLTGLLSICKEDKNKLLQYIRELEKEGYCDIAISIETTMEMAGAKFTFYATKGGKNSLKSQVFVCLGDESEILFNPNTDKK